MSIYLPIYKNIISSAEDSNYNPEKYEDNLLIRNQLIDTEVYEPKSCIEKDTIIQICWVTIVSTGCLSLILLIKYATK